MSFFTLPTQQPRTIDIALLVRIIQVDVLALAGTVVKWTVRAMDKTHKCSNALSQNVWLALRKIACLFMFVYCQSLWSQIHSPVELDRSNPMVQLSNVIFTVRYIVSPDLLLGYSSSWLNCKFFGLIE